MICVLDFGSHPVLTVYPIHQLVQIAYGTSGCRTPSYGSLGDSICFLLLEGGIPPRRPCTSPRRSNERGAGTLRYAPDPTARKACAKQDSKY